MNRKLVFLTAGVLLAVGAIWFLRPSRHPEETRSVGIKEETPATPASSSGAEKQFGPNVSAVTGLKASERIDDFAARLREARDAKATRQLLVELRSFLDGLTP